MKVVKQIEVYLVSKKNTRPIDIVQSDTGIQLVFTVKDFEIPTGTTATLYVQKPSGKFVYQEDEITVDGNTITVDLENQAIVEHGKVPYQVSLENGIDTITTFEGLMLVQRSLKDSGATESRTVIKAFDNVVQNRLNEFQTRAEQVAQAVIATIPEDYTVMTEKVNELANAIKGHLKGTVVKADDVSPVEHEMNVKVNGKNLFDVSKLSNITGKLTNNNDGTLTIAANIYAVTTGKKLNELCPSLKADTVCTLSFLSTSVNAKYIWLNGANVMLYNNTYTFTDEMLNSELYLYGFRDTDDSYGNACTISNIQIEEGTIATEYTPYIDPATVNVRRCGKNLVSVSDEAFTQYKRYEFLTPLPAGSYTLSTIVESTDVDSGTSLLTFELSDGSEMSFNFERGKKIDTTLYAVAKIIAVRLYSGTTYNNSEGDSVRWREFQLEFGKVATDFEPYKGTDHTPSSDGTVSGMMSTAPNMTILTDTEGMIVECEYNKDTNKVIQKLADALGVTI